MKYSLPREPEQVLRDVGRRIYEVRKDRGLTQKELARRLNISEKYLQRCEAGGHRLSIVYIARIAVALGIDARELLRVPKSRAPRRPGRPRKAATGARRRGPVPPPRPAK